MYISVCDPAMNSTLVHSVILPAIYGSLGEAGYWKWMGGYYNIQYTLKVIKKNKNTKLTCFTRKESSYYSTFGYGN